MTVDPKDIKYGGWHTEEHWNFDEDPVLVLLKFWYQDKKGYATKAVDVDLWYSMTDEQKQGIVNELIESLPGAIERGEVRDVGIIAT
jgi:hypothetical protein